jgi:hypothetical protein
MEFGMEKDSSKLQKLKERAVLKDATLVIFQELPLRIQCAILFMLVIYLMMIPGALKDLLVMCDIII